MQREVVSQPYFPLLYTVMVTVMVVIIMVMVI
jgi:hypothetical protein